MPPSKAVRVPLLISLLALQGLALDLGKPIVGCDEVQCPLENSESRCRLGNGIYQAIGLTRIPVVPEPLEDFSILKAVNVSGPASGPLDTITSFYYLGTPQNVSLDDIHGCAVIFHDAPEKQFPQGGTGACSDIIEQGCIDAIQDLATNVSYAYPSRTCQKLQQDLEDNKISACENVTGPGKGIGDISAFKLFNLTNIEGKKNSTSNCWPILPKSANLAPLYAETRGTDGGFKVKDAFSELHRITPMLTLFTATGSKTNVVNETLSRLTCIKINSTDTGSAEEWKRSAASLLAVSMLAASSAFTAFVMIL